MEQTCINTQTQIAARFTEDIWDKGKLEVVDLIFSQNFIDHDPVDGQMPGLNGYKQMVTTFLNAFPDLRVKNEDIIEGRHKVVVRWTAHGTHDGQLMNIPPTGQKVFLKGIDVLKIKDGKIEERWGEFDALSMLRQLGIIQG